MRIGDLNKTIELQSLTNLPDGMGGVITTYITQAIVWAGIWPVSASERIQANQTVMTVSHRIRIRYIANIESSWRIKFGERYFNIISVINTNEANKMLDLMCKEAT